MDSMLSITELVQRLALILKEQKKTIATVESCTGGMVGAAITEIAGVSDVFIGGYITYSDEQKSRAVGVLGATLGAHGAVSGQVAVEMAKGGCKESQASMAVSLTGIAGPDGGNEEKPVGTVWICVATDSGKPDCRRFAFPGDRAGIRTHATITALKMCIQTLTTEYHGLEHQHERFDA